uniref:Uncharacterized protein n=2 Tax=Kalmanozyma brasiliensis (strain GHG001) TaxID=1365824 RepID=V5EYN3_KALBG
MPPTKSQKSGKASKAAKAILHPKSTLAAVKANHAQAADSTSTSASDAAPRSRSPATSIKRASSNASLSSNTAKPLPAAPTSAAPAASASAAPLPSVLAPAINNDILSMKKQLDQPKVVLPASLPPAIAVQSGGSTFVVPAPAPVADTAAGAGDASPYTIDDSAATSTGEQTHDDAPSTVDSTPVTLGSEAVSVPTSFETVSTNSQVKKGNEEFAAEVAAVLAESQPAPVAEPLADAVAAPTPVTAAIVDKASTFVPSAGSPAQPPADPLSTTAPSLTRSISTTAAAAAKVATFTPPELTRLQHNTFVSRPTDASRTPIRTLDPSVLPTPLRPIDRSNGLKRAPSHVLIFGWMDAPIRLVAKYAQPYTVLFPNATVLIQLSDGKSYLAREQVRREQMQRVISEITTPLPRQEKDVGDSTVTLIDHAEATGVEEGGFVIHSFSDGGAGNLAIFLDEMARRKGTTPRVHSLIMDSSPGKSNPRTGSYAFTMHLANRPRVRAVVQFLVFISLYLMKIWAKVTGQPARGELMRKRLNSLRSWSWVTASHAGSQRKEEAGDFPPRMYMYTKADKLIPWQFVEEHARHLADVRKTQPALVQMEKEGQRERVLSAVKDGAEGAGAEYKVELRRWDTPAHCSIGRADFEGYWAGVMDFLLNVLRRE